MILPISLRDKHPSDIKIIQWIKNVESSERSRKVREILLAHIEGTQHIITSDIGNSLTATKEVVDIKFVRGEDVAPEIDLDSKLDSIGGIII